MICLKHPFCLVRETSLFCAHFALIYNIYARSPEAPLFLCLVEAFRENFDSSDCDSNRLLARKLEQTFIGSDSDLQVRESS